MRSWLFALFAVCALTASAADITGNWKATAEGPNGAMERTFVFKVQGNKVTGETTSSMMGKSTLENGKVEGDTVTFTITGHFGDNEMKLDYKGKIASDGNSIKFTVDANGNTIEWNAKRAN